MITQLDHLMYLRLYHISNSPAAFDTFHKTTRHYLIITRCRQNLAIAERVASGTPAGDEEKKKQKKKKKEARHRLQQKEQSATVETVATPGWLAFAENARPEPSSWSALSNNGRAGIPVGPFLAPSTAFSTSALLLFQGGL